MKKADFVCCLFFIDRLTAILTASPVKCPSLYLALPKRSAAYALVLVFLSNISISVKVKGQVL